MSNFSAAVTYANEIVKAVDFAYAHDQAIANVALAINAVLSKGNADFIIGGKVIPYVSGGMNVSVEPIYGHCASSGIDFIETSPIAGPISVEAADPSLDRIDIVQVRGIEEFYDEQDRKFRDPSTGVETTQRVATKKRVKLDIAIKKGPLGSVTAPPTDNGYVKLAEISIPAGTIGLNTPNIKNITSLAEGNENSEWTLEKTRTYNPGYFTSHNSMPMQEHNEDGTHKAGVIKAANLLLTNAADAVKGSVLPTGRTINLLGYDYSPLASITNVLEALAGEVNTHHRSTNSLYTKYDLLEANPVAASTENIDVETGGEQVIDGIPCTVGQMVFLKDQTNKIENGFWEVRSGAWRRYAGYTDLTPNAFNLKFILVNAGTANRGKVFYLIEETTSIGTTPLDFVENKLLGILTSLFTFGTLDIIGGGIDMADVYEEFFPVGAKYIQEINDPDPIEAGLPGQWQPWSGRADAYRLTASALPAFAPYAQGANYAAADCVSWHLPGTGWELWKAKAAITNAAEQLNPILWEKYLEGEIVERRFLQDWLDSDFELGGQIASGEHAGKYVSEVISLGGTFPSIEGGNRPPFVDGGIAGDCIRNIKGSLYRTHGDGRLIDDIIETMDRIVMAINKPGDFYLDKNWAQTYVSYAYATYLDPSVVVPVGFEDSPRTASFRKWRRVA